MDGGKNMEILVHTMEKFMIWQNPNDTTIWIQGQLTAGRIITQNDGKSIGPRSLINLRRNSIQVEVDDNFRIGSMRGMQR